MVGLKGIPHPETTHKVDNKVGEYILPIKRTIMRNQSLLITACAVSLLLLLLMPIASAVAV